MQLIGRDHELAALRERLASRRIVTVIGPGGIGKTSLARAAAAAADGDYPMGVRLIDLTRVAAPDGVGGAIAGQLGFPSFTALLDSPTEQPALLVIDNCEHVLDAVASAIAQLLEACSSPTVLATSRSPLDLPGESLVVLGPLTMPAAGVADPEVASIRLFLERARDAGVELGTDQLPIIAELCRSLDGLPLALEMAAARTRVLAPAEILARLGDLDTLARPRFRGADRHRSLRSTIEWSYEQLNARDQRFFDRVGVIGRHFDGATAHAVAADPGEDPSVTAGSIEALVSASMLVSEAVDGATVYYQLETLRTYALERLAEGDASGSTRERFADHVVGGVVGVMSQGRREWDAGVLAALLGMYDDIAAALQWCVDNDAGPDRSLTLLSVLWGVIHQGHVDDVAPLGEATLERWPDPTVPLWGDAAATVATCRFLLGRPWEAIELARHALATAERSLFAPCTLRRVIGQASFALGDMESALGAFEDAASEARRREILPLAMELDVFAAQILAESGHADEALEALRTTRAEAARRGSDINEAWAITTEGYVLLRVDVSAATAVIDEALDLSRRLDYPACIAANMQAHAIVSTIEGRDADAAGRLLDLIDFIAHRGAVGELRIAFQVAAVVLHRIGNPTWSSLAATAASLPVVSMFATPGHELLRLTTPEARPLSRREAVLGARRELVAVRDGRPAPATPSADREVRGRPHAEHAFTRAGDFWDVAFAGRRATVKTSKGMEDLGRLLAAPERDLHCLE
ncbi:MAG: ATP-binding protein, partial [Ilumatobacteraceae bacterium]